MIGSIMKVNLCNVPWNHPYIKGVPGRAHLIFSEGLRIIREKKLPINDCDPTSRYDL